MEVTLGACSEGGVHRRNVEKAFSVLSVREEEWSEDILVSV
jgi:hypothetical protein